MAKFGINAQNVSLDVGKMLAQKDKSVKTLTGGIEGLFKKNKVAYVKGWGKMASANEVEVDLNDGGKKTLWAKNILLATGSEVMTIPGVTLDEKRVVSSTGALTLSAVPKKMIVIGGGVIGLEMGSVWSRLGAEVTVVEFAGRIVPSLDAETAKTFQRILEKQHFKFMFDTKVMKVDNVPGQDLKVTVDSVKGGAPQVLTADVVLVSTGRRPFTDGLNLEVRTQEPPPGGRRWHCGSDLLLVCACVRVCVCACGGGFRHIPQKVGVAMDGKKIKINGHFQTNVPSIYAIGDVVTGPMLAHKAEEEGIACVENLAGKAGHVNYDTIPNVIYTHPEVACVGKTEEELKAAGVKYRLGKFPFLANSRAKANDDADGQIKVLVDATTDRILGIHIVGPSAGEMIAEGVLGMEYGASAEDIARTCHAHPTLSEAFKEACMAAYDKPIHF